MPPPTAATLDEAPSTKRARTEKAVLKSSDRPMARLVWPSAQQVSFISALLNAPKELDLVLHAEQTETERLAYLAGLPADLHSKHRQMLRRMEVIRVRRGSITKSFAKLTAKQSTSLCASAHQSGNQMAPAESAPAKSTPAPSQGDARGDQADHAQRDEAALALDAVHERG